MKHRFRVAGLCAALAVLLTGCAEAADSGYRYSISAGTPSYGSKPFRPSETVASSEAAASVPPSSEPVRSSTLSDRSVEPFSSAPVSSAPESVCETTVSVSSVEPVSSEPVSSFPEPVTVITIPADAVEYLPSEALAYPDATAFALENGNGAFSVRDGMLFNASGTVLIRCPLGKSGDVCLPEGVVSIGPEAFFQCTKLTAIRLPEGLQSIGDLAFGACTALEEIVLPESVSDMGLAVFLRCNRLRSVFLIGKSENPPDWPANWYCGPSGSLRWDKSKKVIDTSCTS